MYAKTKKKETSLTMIKSLFKFKLILILFYSKTFALTQAPELKEAITDNNLKNYSLENIRLEASAWLGDQLSSEYENFKLQILKHDKGTKNQWSCTHSVQYSLSNPSTKNSRVSVLAQCQEPRWSLLTGFYQEIYEEVAYMNKDLRVHQILESDDITWKKENILKLHRQYLTRDNICQYLGMKAKKSLSQGDLIRPQHWKLADLIKKNQKVDIIYEKNGLRVQATGRACENGTLGKIITVENIRSKSKVQAMVLSKNSVQVS